MNLRIIPRLDIKGKNLVKGIHLEGLRVLGAPELFAKLYNEHGADELIYIDSVASLYGRENLVEIVKKTATNIFIPICAGGGVRNEEDASVLLRNGADKVSINSAAVRTPNLIRSLSLRFGSSTVVSHISVKKRDASTYEVYIDNGRERTGLCPIEWAEKVEQLGAGEILLESIDQEGTGRGFNIDLAERVARVTSIPLILTGGCGQPEHVVEAHNKTGVSAFSIGSMLHHHYRENYECLKSEAKSGHYPVRTTHFASLDIFKFKDALLNLGLEVRKIKVS